MARGPGGMPCGMPWGGPFIGAMCIGSIGGATWLGGGVICPGGSIGGCICGCGSILGIIWTGGICCTGGILGIWTGGIWTGGIWTGGIWTGGIWMGGICCMGCEGIRMGPGMLGMVCGTWYPGSWLGIILSWFGNWEPKCQGHFVVSSSMFRFLNILPLSIKNHVPSMQFMISFWFHLRFFKKIKQMAMSPKTTGCPQTLGTSKNTAFATENEKINKNPTKHQVLRALRDRCSARDPLKLERRHLPRSGCFCISTAGQTVFVCP